MSVHNGGPSLVPTLESILRQSDQDFEVIIVDDGSTDASAAILGRYAAADRRVRVLTQENVGITAALIRGCALARGRYVARHDAGDISKVNRLRIQRELLDEDPSLTFVSCWTRFVGPAYEHLYVARGTGVATEPTRILDASLPTCAIDGPTHHGSVVFRRDAYERVGGYRSAFRVGQDWDLWYRLAEIGRFRMAAKVLYLARTTPRSISVRDRATQERIAKYTHDAVRARLRGESDSKSVQSAAEFTPRSRHDRRSIARGYYFIGEALRRNGDRRTRMYLWKAILTWPLQAKAWVRLVQSLVLPRPAAESSMEDPE